jgi:hypothetical protein
MIMNHILFEKVTVEQAEAVINAGPAHTRSPVLNQDWSLKRQPAATQGHELAGQTFAWFSKLPKEKRPKELARRFPHVANRLAGLWSHSLQCELYFDDLVMDLRGGRRGFPPEVSAEITALREYFLTVVAPVRYDVWGERIGLTPD